MSTVTSHLGYNIYTQLESVLKGIGLSSKDAGGSILFYEADPFISSPLRFASCAAIGLMAKSIAIAKIWRLRNGQPQDISISLGKALRRLSPFYEKKWELINGSPPSMPSNPPCPFMPNNFYETRDHRLMLLLNIYPHLKKSALKILKCAYNSTSIARAVKKWNSKELEKTAAELGFQATMIRSMEEFSQEEQYGFLHDSPLIEIEKIGDSSPRPFPKGGNMPLDNVRALGLGHVIAGSAIGRTLALHGADVLNIWRPHDFEFDLMYFTANVGMRSSFLEIGTSSEFKKFCTLLKKADIFFANRRPGWLEQFALSPFEAAAISPGIIHATVSLYGTQGPWKNRIGFDQAAGAATGLLALEGTLDNPKLPQIFVVNDYLVSWLAAAGILSALILRSQQGGSYRVHVSLARAALWIHSQGIIERNLDSPKIPLSESTFSFPDIFTANTPCGIYQGVTDQVVMSETPGHYRHVLVPRGTSKSCWL